ncbi:two-component system response regulator RppA [Synechococcus sp. MW101C3]|uniref:two-component system response regulator RppA n=1 Tax=Synechococcus sp. MW101C3 TaxID=210768 RepID=UPI0018E924B0|nr:two-component system response regulator RppA [Synechococcus sp. MW101C3]
MPLRILLVEDEAELAGAIQAVLRAEQHVVDHVAEGLGAWSLLRSELTTYNLLIVDWMLPGVSGPELCQRVRGAGLTLPVLMLTALADTSHRVQGLDAGADDYLSKPFAMEELLARIRALQRRQPNYREPLLNSGPYVLDPAEGCLTVQRGKETTRITLSTKELQLMAYFMEHPREIIPGSRLRSQLWSLDEDPISNVVAAQVRLLRRKIASYGLACPIATVPSKGYRFDPEPEEEQ